MLAAFARSTPDAQQRPRHQAVQNRELRPDIVDGFGDMEEGFLPSLPICDRWCSNRRMGQDLF